MQVERMIKQQREITYPYLSELFARIGVSHEMTQSELRRLLDPHGEEILKWSLEELNRKCNERGIPLVVLYVPTTEEINGLDPERAPDLLRILEETGIPTLMVDEPYRGRTSADVQLRPWDTHLSKIGHEVVAERLYEVLLEAPRAGAGLTLNRVCLLSGSPHPIHPPICEPSFSRIGGDLMACFAPVARMFG
jgi:hypothetical protein